jgi:ketose-bisphosphate aldolase
LPAAPLAGLDTLMKVAKERNICVPAFDAGVGRPEFVQAAIEVCRRHNAVALFLAGPWAAKRFGFSALASMVRELAGQAGVPAVLHLDHGTDEADILAAIDAGFSSVMFDAGELSFEENVARTRRCVELGHSRGVAVEGELGAIGREGSAEGKTELTDPDLAARFVEETGVDVFTPSVGNRHGCVGFTVPLNWELITSMHEKVAVPMALHGGSGVAIEDVKRIADFGFRKFNLATMLHAEYSRAVKDYITKNPEQGWGRWAAAGRQALETIIERYVTELGNQDTAGGPA